MRITQVNVWLKRMVAALFDKIGIVIFKRKDGYAYLEVSRYIEKKQNYEYLEEGTFIIKKPNYAYLEEGTFITKRPNYAYLEGGTFILTKPGYTYVPDYFASTRHKQIDIRTLQGFGQLAQQIIEHGNTLLGYDRLYIIYQAMQSLKRLVNDSACMHLAEIGAYRGGTSNFIASCARVFGLNVVLHSFDTFGGHASTDIQSGIDNGTVHTPGLFDNTSFDLVSAYLREFKNIKLYKGRFQETSSQVESLRFHFVHLDVDLYAPTIYALNFLSQRLVNGGVIVVDDYGNLNCPGIMQAVGEFINYNQRFIVLSTLTGQVVLIKHQVADSLRGLPSENDSV